MTTPADTDRIRRWLGRIGSIHIIESGRDDHHASLDRSLASNCRTLITETFENSTATSQVEILLLPAGPSGYTCCLHGRVSSKIPGTHPTQPLHPAPESTTTIAEAAAHSLPDVYGIETGDLDLSPLLSGCSVTDRAVETTTDWSLASTTASIRDLYAWARQHDRTPLIIQLLVEYSSSPPYDVTLRVLQLAERPPTTRPEFGSLLDNGVQSPVAALPSESLRTARQLAANEWDAKATPRTVHEHAFSYPSLGRARMTGTLQPTRATRSRQAATSHRETQGLVNAAALNNHYDSFDVNPQLTAERNGLKWLLDVFPLPRDTHIGEHDWLARPQFARDEVVREPTASTRTDVLPAPTQDDWAHQTHERTAIDVIQTWLALDSPTTQTHPFSPRSSSPHLIDDSPVVDGGVVLVDKHADSGDIPVGTAGGLVLIANSVVDNAVPLCVLAVDRASAEWATQVLRAPFRDVTRTAGEPYMLPKRWEVGDTIIPLVDDNQQWEWRVTPAEQWQFLVDSEVRASGSLTELTAPETLSLPRLVERNDGFELLTPGGDSRGQYDSIADVDEDYRQIPRPVGPRWPTYAGYATVLYVESGSLRPLWGRPEWRQRFTTKPKTEYHEAAAREFVATRTIKRQRGDPPARDVQPWLSQYFLGQSDYRYNSMWVTDLTEILQTRVRHTDDGRVVLPARSWVFPPHPGTAAPPTSPSTHDTVS